MQNTCIRGIINKQNPSKNITHANLKADIKLQCNVFLGACLLTHVKSPHTSLYDMLGSRNDFSSGLHDYSE